MKAVAVIPARYDSSRFPGKPLAKILGKPMIIHVLERTSLALDKEHVYVATDDERIFDEVQNHGYNAVMTSKDCATGTDRLWDFAQKISADIYINVQGDEPLINPSDIQKVIELKTNNLNKVVNCMSKLDQQDKNDLTIPKVVTNKFNELIYMSRSDIPSLKASSSKSPTYFKQVCIYGFSFNELREFADFGKVSEIEIAEDIEILRFLILGKKVLMHETESNTIAVDLPEHINKVEKYILSNEF